MVYALDPLPSADAALPEELGPVEPTLGCCRTDGMQRALAVTARHIGDLLIDQSRSSLCHGAGVTRDGIARRAAITKVRSGPGRRPRATSLRWSSG